MSRFGISGGRWRAGRFLLFIVAGLVLVSAAHGEQRFPPPDFTDHALPVQQVKPLASPWIPYLDTALLAAALGAATYLALVRRSRRGLFVLAILCLGYFGFWRLGCVCPIGSIQNVVLAGTDPTYPISFAVIAFFALPILVTLFFGRTFCAAVCPLGAIQEVVAVRPIKVPGWLEHTLGLIPYIYLGAAVLFAATGTAFIICRYDPFIGLFRLSGPTEMIVLGVCLLVIGLFVGRPYCRYLCPYGALLGLLSKVSRRHVRIEPEKCINCRLCEDACPYNAIRPPTAPPTLEQLSAGRRRLILLLILLPVLMALSAWGVGSLGGVMSRSDRRIQLAERIRLEETGQVEGTTDESDAFRNTGLPSSKLYERAAELRGRFRLYGYLLGGWIGLVIGVKLITVSIRRRRTQYEPDRGACVSCGRCFWYCPYEQVRLGLIDDVNEILPPGEQMKTKEE